MTTAAAAATNTTATATATKHTKTGRSPEEKDERKKPFIFFIDDESLYLHESNHTNVPTEKNDRGGNRGSGKNGTTAEDWSQIAVSEGFDPAQVERSRLEGRVEIGEEPALSARG